MLHQVAQNFFPGLEITFVPVTVPLAFLRPDKGILDATAEGAIFVPGPDVDRIIRRRSSGMGVPDKTTLDPFVTDVTGRERIENQCARLDITADVEHFLFLRIIHFEDDMRVIEGHPERHAAGFDEIGDLADLPEIL